MVVPELSYVQNMQTAELMNQEKQLEKEEKDQVVVEDSLFSSSFHQKKINGPY